MKSASLHNALNVAAIFLRMASSFPVNVANLPLMASAKRLKKGVRKLSRDLRLLNCFKYLRQRVRRVEISARDFHACHSNSFRNNGGDYFASSPTATVLAIMEPGVGRNLTYLVGV